MKRLVCFLVFLLASTAALAETAARYNVVLRSDVARERLPRVVANAEEARVRQVRTFRNVNAFSATLTASEVAELRRSGVVESIQPVLRRSISSLPGEVETTVSPFKRQSVPWGIDAIKARDVWPVTQGSAQVHVAVIDTGIEEKHADLVHAYAGGVNIIDPAKPPHDDHKHGTHVAGTIAAANNNIGVVGVAPNVKLWAVKVLNHQGDGTDEGVAAGIDWVVTKSKEVGGRWVINLSLGAYEHSVLEDRAVQNAIANGVVVVAGAGNRSLAILDYPAGYRNVIAVGATDSKHQLAEFSSFGPGMTLVAPGVSVASTLPEGINTAADVEFNGATYDGWGLTGAPKGSIEGPFVYVGVGNLADFPVNMAGKIAVASRGEIQFRIKARNAKEAGAKGLIIINSADDKNDLKNWSLIVQTCNENGCSIEPDWVDYQFPLTIGVSYEDGQKILAMAAANSSSPAIVEYRWEPYGSLDGTSMSTPHVAGAAALLLALDPTANVAQIARALEVTATDLGDEGWDLRFASGLLNVYKAAQWLKPSAFGLQQPPTTSPGKRRSGRS